jgi:hypothetical protein
MPPEFARRMYGYYSGAAHGVAWALLESIDMATLPSSGLEANTRYLYSSARGLFAALAVAAESYRRAFQTRLEYMRWDDTDWLERTVALETEVKRVTFVDEESAPWSPPC